MKKHFLFIIALSLIFFVPSSWSKEDPAKYPSKPITMLLAFPGGGVVDLTARKLAELASPILGQPIVIEHRPGGSGAIALTALATAPGDGYTIGTIPHSATTLIPYLTTVHYKTKEDFGFIIQYGRFTHFFVVKPDASWKTFRDFIEDARKRPGGLLYGTQGAKSVNHLVMELIAKEEGVTLTHVPFRGDAEGIAAVLGGHVHGSLNSSAPPYIKTGKLRALLTDKKERAEIATDVPTIGELGYKIDPPLFLGLGTPKGVPQEIMVKLEEAFTKAFNDPSFKEACKQLEMTPVYRTGREFREYVFKQFDIMAKNLKDVGWTN